MNNTIQIFENKEFDAIRTMSDEQGRTWFCGKDVAEALGYNNGRDAIRKQGGYMVLGADESDEVILARALQIMHTALERREKEIALLKPKAEYADKRAVHLFRQELRLTRGLLDALKRVGYRENQRVLTPRQVQVIEEFLGEP